MKKKNLIIFSLIAVIVVIAVSMFYPYVDQSESMGTIGKVDKYRNDKTGQDKIVLRSEFLQDTTALKATIIALAQYETFLESLSGDFSEWEKKIKEVDTKEFDKDLNELNSLVVYMNNNLKTVVNTRELLIKYYMKDNVDMTIDVENNLLEFSTFLTNLDKKSAVVDSLFIDLTGLVDDEKISLLSLTNEETEKLKVVREKMLGGIFILGYVMGNEEKLNMALSSNVMDAIVFNRELNNKLGLLGKENLGKKMGKEELGVVHGKDELGYIRKNEELGINKAFYHNNEQLNHVFSKEKLGYIRSKDNLSANSNEKLDFITRANEVVSAINNKPLGTYSNFEKLGLIFQANKYVFSKENFSNSGSLSALLGRDENLQGSLENNQLESFKALSNALNAFGAKNKLGFGYWPF